MVLIRLCRRFSTLHRSSNSNYLNSKRHISNLMTRCVTRYLSTSAAIFHDDNSTSKSKWEFFNNPNNTSQQSNRVIQDVIEQQWNPLPVGVPSQMEPSREYNLERGKSGVFDLEELLDLLKEENAKDICVISIPKEMDYTDHMVIVTARSPKHMHALAIFIRSRFKSKHLLPTDRLPKIEGDKTTEDWLALDMINIVLHIFCKEGREFYDLETLWTVGPNFDDKTNEEDSEIVRLLNLFK